MAVDSVPAASEPAPRRRRLLITVSVVLLLIMAAGLRLYRLGMPDLWGDEILYLRMCHPGLSVMETILEHTRSYSYIGHLPSTAVLTNLGLKAMGAKGKSDITSFNARVPSVMMGVMTLVLLALWLARISGNAWVGLSCLAVGAFSYLHIWYSREAYHYPGEILYAVVLCFAFWEATVAGLSPKKSIALLTVTSFSALLAAFSHPTGALMPAVLAVNALGVALLWERRNWRLYVSALILAGIAVTPMLMAGTGQQRNSVPRPWMNFFAETWHLLQFMTLGPGLWRGVMGAILLGIGVSAVLQHGARREKLLLLLFPLLLVTIHSSRTYPYIPRYFLLLWPFATWILARAIGWLCMAASGAGRGCVLAVVTGGLILSAVPGYIRLYAIEGKRDCQAMLRDELDSRLPEGTICVWDGGHALRFVPDFHPTKKLMLFGALPDSSLASYEQGRVQQSLRLLASSFPSVAFIEWGHATHNPGDDILSSGQAFGRQVSAILPEHVGVLGAGFEELVRSGWYPCTTPRLLADSAKRDQSGISHAVQHVYYRTMTGSNSVQPVFAPQNWQLVFLSNGAPVILGSRRSIVRLKSTSSLGRASINVRIDVIAFAPGSLMCRRDGGWAVKVGFDKAGQMRTINMPVPMPSCNAVFEFVPASFSVSPREPLFGVLAVLSTRQPNRGSL